MSLSLPHPEERCLFCNILIIQHNQSNTTTTKTSKKKNSRRSSVGDPSSTGGEGGYCGLSRPLAQVLCKALDVPFTTFAKNFTHSPVCKNCQKRVAGVKHIVLALETLERSVQEFRLQMVETLEEAHHNCATPTPSQDQGHVSSIHWAQNILRKQIIDLLSGWKESYQKTFNNKKRPTSLEHKDIFSIKKEKSDEIDYKDPGWTIPQSDPDHLAVIDNDNDNYNLNNKTSLICTSPSPPNANTDSDTVVGSLYSPEDHRGSSSDEKYSDKEEDDTDQENDTVKQKQRCALCKSSFKSFFDLDIHTKRAHQGMKRPFVCGFADCKRTFRQRYLWKRHQQLHTTGEDLLKRYFCDVCSKSYESRNSLSRHQSSHTGQWKYTCPQCPKGFHRPSALKIHLAQEHDEELPYPCPNCDEKFSTARRRLVHRSAAHPEDTKPSATTACDLCSKVFSGRDALRCHKMQLHGQGRFTFHCETCSKGFAKKSWLVRHSLQHSSEKTYACDECDEAFRFPNSLACHKLKHRNLTPFSCSQCSKGFRLKTQWKLHELTHTGKDDKTHICEYCGKTFALAVYLTHHLKRIHFKEMGLEARPTYLRKMNKKKSSTKTEEGSDRGGSRKPKRNPRVRPVPSQEIQLEEQVEEQPKMEIVYEEQMMEEYVVEHHNQDQVVQVLQLGSLHHQDNNQQQQFIQVFVQQ